MGERLVIAKARGQGGTQERKNILGVQNFFVPSSNFALARVPKDAGTSMRCWVASGSCMVPDD